MSFSDLPLVHGGLACYDATDESSVECIPDLLGKLVAPPLFLCTLVIFSLI